MKHETNPKDMLGAYSEIFLVGLKKDYKLDGGCTFLDNNICRTHFSDYVFPIVSDVLISMSTWLCKQNN